MPTARAPPDPRAAATSPYAITRPRGIVSTRSSTDSANGVGRPATGSRSARARAVRDREEGDVTPGILPACTPPGHRDATIFRCPGPRRRTTTSDNGTVVIEDGVIPRRVRRPADLLRMALALLAAVAIVVVSYFLNSTSTGIDQDLTNASNRLPSLLMLALNIVAGLGVLALPLVAAIDLLARRRSRQLVEAVGALVVAAVLALLVATAVRELGSEQLIIAITNLSDPRRAGPRSTR